MKQADVTCPHSGARPQHGRAPNVWSDVDAAVFRDLADAANADSASPVRL